MNPFEVPELSVSTFDMEDVITASGGFGGGCGAWEDELPR